MARIRQGIDIDVPAAVAYAQWTQFEDFPQFMDGVERVVHEDDRTLGWTATIAGQRRHWRAEIVDQTPTCGSPGSPSTAPRTRARRCSRRSAPDRCHLDLTIDAEPADPLEAIGTALPILERRVRGDLERFKAFIERRGAPTGAWTGEIHGERVESPR